MIVLLPGLSFSLSLEIVFVMRDKPGLTDLKRPQKAFQLFLRDEKGVTAIEFGFVAFPFLFFIFAIIEIGVSFTAQQMLNYATDDLSRQFYTGQITQENLNSGSVLEIRNKICGKVSIIRIVGCDKLYVNLDSYTSFSEVPIKNLVTKDGYLGLPVRINLGGPSTINQLNVLYRWPVMTNILYYMKQEVEAKDRVLPLFSTITWQNEPFS